MPSGRGEMPRPTDNASNLPRAALRCWNYCRRRDARSRDLFGALAFLEVFDLLSGQHTRLVGVAIEAIGKNQQGRCPQADENAEALGVRALFRSRILSLKEPPDSNGKCDGDDAPLETEVAEKSTGAGIHDGWKTERKTHAFGAAASFDRDKAQRYSNLGFSDA